MVQLPFQMNVLLFEAFCMPRVRNMASSCSKVALGGLQLMQLLLIKKKIDATFVRMRLFDL
jgi:hypothetical protein